MVPGSALMDLLALIILKNEAVYGAEGTQPNVRPVSRSSWEPVSWRDKVEGELSLLPFLIENTREQGEKVRLGGGLPGYKKGGLQESSRS